MTARARHRRRLPWLLGCCAMLSINAAPLSARNIGLRAVAMAGLGEELTCLGVSHRNHKLVFIGTATGAIYRTDDAGATWQQVLVTPQRSLFYGRERSPDPRLEYALGLPGKSPHLQSWLRSKGARTAGLNLQQLLVLKGDKSTTINWIEVDWHDEQRIFVGTTDGLYRSTDGGRNFLRIWQGRTGIRERVVNTVVTDPATPNRLIVGTAQGLFYSTNAGTTMRKEMDFYIRDSYIRALYFSREQKGLLHMAMGGASMASPDGGENWITTHWSLWSPRGDVQWISLGPENVRVMGTGDGVWASAQGGEMGSWQRRGMRFVNNVVNTVLATKTPGQWYATTELALWETKDAGESWYKVFQLGGSESPRWVHAYDGDASKLWLLTNRQLYRVGEPKALRPAPRPRREPRLLDFPDLHQFWKVLLKKKLLYFDDVIAYKQRAPYAALLPRLSLYYFYSPTVDALKLRAFPYLHYDFLYYNRQRTNEHVVEAWAYWELSRLIFDRRELPHFGRIERNLAWLRRDITERVNRLYRVYREVATRLALNPPAEPLAREFMRIRLQEIAGYFDGISGGYWSKKSGGIR
ncbi:MAG: hypothetical protein H6707_02700 [Deltaproteobacteria bacterium]|nr:hypothetical protein [Deltaproteobacteria bacterium]